jgi:hypothetical protein
LLLFERKKVRSEEAEGKSEKNLGLSLKSSVQKFYILGLSILQLAPAN